jgi:hypothetical protein
VGQELERRPRAELELSLRNPHPETRELADLGIGDWLGGLPEEDDLLDPEAGTEVCWAREELFSSTRSHLGHEQRGLRPAVFGISNASSPEPQRGSMTKPRVSA